MISSQVWLQKAEGYLHRLCVEIPSRRVGSGGNRKATELFAAAMATFGFETHTSVFDCIDWSSEGASLTVDGAEFEVFPSPYSLGCHAEGPLVVVSTVDELEKAEVGRGILLLRGDITSEQLMPKNFPFYNPDSHRLIVELLEAKGPQAIIAATGQDLEMVGNIYPFPMIEDGDFDIPSVYMTEEEGLRLSECAGKVVSLDSRATRIQSKGQNVIGRKGADQDRRIVLFAHIDARMGTPGANDNATGVVALLLLAELLADYSGHTGVELVAMNGEDYYSNPGEQLYLAENSGRFGELVLGINLDDVGYHKGRVAYSLYGCPGDLEASVRTVFSEHDGLIEGPQWYAGDHGLFLLNQVPAVAITSELMTEMMAEITHTPHDTPDKVDGAKLVQVARALYELILRLDGEMG